MINILSFKSKGEGISAEDLEKIEKLKAEREECLAPVKIRITGDLPALQASTGSDTPTGLYWLL
jgi:hypothetical protein